MLIFDTSVSKCCHHCTYWKGSGKWVLRHEIGECLAPIPDSVKNPIKEPILCASIQGTKCPCYQQNPEIVMYDDMIKKKRELRCQEC